MRLMSLSVAASLCFGVSANAYSDGNSALADTTAVRSCYVPYNQLATWRYTHRHHFKRVAPVRLTVRFTLPDPLGDLFVSNDQTLLPLLEERPRLVGILNEELLLVFPAPAPAALPLCTNG